MRLAKIILLLILFIFSTEVFAHARVNAKVDIKTQNDTLFLKVLSLRGKKALVGNRVVVLSKENKKVLIDTKVPKSGVLKVKIKKEPYFVYTYIGKNIDIKLINEKSEDIALKVFTVFSIFFLMISFMCRKKA